MNAVYLIQKKLFGSSELFIYLFKELNVLKVISFVKTKFFQNHFLKNAFFRNFSDKYEETNRIVNFDSIKKIIISIINVLKLISL